MQHIIRLLRDVELEKSRGESGNATESKNGPTLPKIDRCTNILQSLFNLENQLDSIPLTVMNHMGGVVGRTFPGVWLLEAMERSGFHQDSVGVFDVLGVGGHFTVLILLYLLRVLC